MTARAFLRWLSALCLTAAMQAPAAAETEVDLELVLAVDVSGSVDAAEYGLQMSGIAAGLRDPEVLAAIAKGARGRIAVTVAFWAESDQPKDALPWAVIDGPAAAGAFAGKVEGYARTIPGGGTGIGRGVVYAVRLIQANGITSQRRVVDVSGDGRESVARYFSVPATQARSYAAARGVTVNGLAILSDDPELEAWYRDHVITGPDAFTLAAADFEDFAEAMRRKLIREIESRPKVSHLAPR